MRASMSILGMYRYDPTILDAVTLPEGVDREEFTNRLLATLAELEVLYPEPETLKTAERAWSYARQQSWLRMQRALSEDYNPLHNYDRHEEWLDEGAADSSRTDKVAGYNDAAALKDSTSSDGSATTSNERTGHAWGNIGTTTSATMLREEIEVRSKYDLVDIIINEYKQEFCLQLY